MWTQCRWDSEVFEEVPLACRETLRRETGLPVITYRSKVHPSFMVGIVRDGMLTQMGYVSWPNYDSPNPSPADIHRIVAQTRNFEPREATRFRGYAKDRDRARECEEDLYRRVNGQYGIYRYYLEKYGQVKADRWLYQNGLDHDSLSRFGFRV